VGRTVAPWLLALALLAPAVGCSESSEVAPGAGAARADAPSAGAQASQAEARPAPARRATRREPPLPAFEGWTLDQERLAVSSLLGRRTLFFLFNPDVREAEPVGRAVAAIAQQQQKHNFAVVGVAQGTDRESARAFLAELGIEAPAFDDQAGAFGARVGLRQPVGLLLVDAEGYMVQASGAPGMADDPAATMETLLREWLRLPPPGAEPAGTTERQKAPAFRAERLEGGEPFELASLAGRPAVLVFFLHTCPHCHTALEFFREELARLPEASRPKLLGISVVNQTIAVRDRLRQDGLDFFPVLLDGDGAIRAAYDTGLGVPVTFLIDEQGRIAARADGWREDRDPPLMRMRLAQLAGQPVPMLLHRTGYSGNEFCAVCHESEAETWELTNHARAFDTLVRHGVDRRDDCVGCHVVGWGHEGGYSLERPMRTLEDVGCETCHGRGGPHLSPGFAPNHDYEAACLTCHTPEHSLGFDYASFLPRVSHAANAAIAALPAEERARILAERRAPRKDLLPSDAEVVGSAACQSCHPGEHATWSEHAHAHSLRSLEAAGKAGDPECLACHTTAYGKPGGFPAGGVPADHPDLAVVGCESCHGPGGEHVKPDTPKIGTIVSLGDKCDSCVILQICGTCHDDANDPGFEYQVLEKIERQRHGTIEPGTGKPKPAPGAAMRLPSSTVTGALEEAFRSDTAPELGQAG
jgi:peroxiredoxin